MTQVRKRVFLRHLVLKMIVLPRQARDKHSTRESTQKRDDAEAKAWRVKAFELAAAVNKSLGGGGHWVSGVTNSGVFCVHFMH